ncbi:hypothetical protein OM416_19765 [Paenibacillus sp. LS1]|uniref:hypothetical protein n=1 Tax=Paenibacillus sp. LS1 TaxID=2992120 RepID=UPI00222E1E39|nr:hypothetical protein [Paenibacillus sp. LS1]MCW3793833.1 hypothetical protein [Paenibacillus sp. LS1]
MMDEDTINHLFFCAIVILVGIIGGIKINNAYKSALRSKLQQCDQALEFYSKLDFYLWALHTGQIQLERPPQDLYEQSSHYLHSSEIEGLIEIHSKSTEEITQFYDLIKDRVLDKKEEQLDVIRKIYGNKKREEPE